MALSIGAELLRRCTVARLNRQAFQHGRVEGGEIIDIGGCGEVALRDTSRQTISQCPLAIQAVPGKGSCERPCSQECPKRRQYDHAAARVSAGHVSARILPEHGFDSLSGRDHLIEALRDGHAFQAIVQFDRFAEKLLLASEGRIETRLIDPHGIDEVLDRVPS